VRSARRTIDDADDWTRSRVAALVSILHAIGRRPKDAIAVGLSALAICGGIVNALFLQSGPHPAPIFAPRPLAAGRGHDATGTVKAVLPRPRPPDLEPVKVDALAAQRPRPEIVAEIQRELGRRGFYDGPADGIYGAKTDSSIRDFEQALHLNPSNEPNEALLKAIKTSPAKTAALTPPLPIPRPATAPAPAPHSDPIAEILGPSKRVISIQRALADFGYGQIKPTGIINPETEAAIEKFERDRKMPITGQISDRLARELSAMTGRPLEQ
jgi:peptidoglycan hydrolase-like protein with peptidoglycan-binding domain